MKETVSQATIDRYLATSGLDVQTKTTLLAEFKESGNDRKVLDKAVRLSGRKSMSKVPQIHSK